MLTVVSMKWTNTTICLRAYWSTMDLTGILLKVSYFHSRISFLSSLHRLQGALTTFNYTFLPDMSLATATTTSELARMHKGSTAGTWDQTDTSASGGKEGLSGVSYPSQPPSYPYGSDSPGDSASNAVSTYAPTPYHHIPRPPNAFILFRSAFIKSRKISSEIEGNHSTLSKIIGECFCFHLRPMVPLSSPSHRSLYHELFSFLCLELSNYLLVTKRTFLFPFYFF